MADATLLETGGLIAVALGLVETLKFAFRSKNGDSNGHSKAPTLYERLATLEARMDALTERHAELIRRLDKLAENLEHLAEAMRHRDRHA
jgi:hypothetical protein